MEETLNRITEIIEEFNSSNNHNPQGLLDMGFNLLMTAELTSLSFTMEPLGR